MSSGGGTTTSTTQQKSDPWAPAQPYLTDIMSQAQGLYNSQKGQNSYAPFNTVTPQSDTTLQGLDLTSQRALNGSPINQAAGSSLTDILNGGANTGPGNGTLQSLTGGYSDPGNAEAQWITRQNFNDNPASKYLSDMASSDSINPYLTAQYNAASKPVIDSINAQFSQAGRTGSAANQDVLTRNLGDLSSNIFANGYQNAQQNRLAATGQIQSAFDNAGSRDLQAAGLLSSNAANQAQVRGNAANNLNSSYQNANSQRLQAANLAPSIAGQDYTDLQNLLNVGGAKDAQSAAQIQDLLTRWQYGNTQPWNILQQYGGAVSGLGGLMPASTSGTSSQTQPSQSMIPSLLGAGISAASMFSDERLKTDIQRVGTADNGLPLYLFKYKGDNQTRLGLMAQDVEKVKPEAVELDPSGFKRVNYQSALAA